ncbi:alpha/beta fold hydrolase [Pseudomonas sp. LPB0260]|uniref:alpha/beta fold hydrolase n=1 Tax=Pseudomonas sp. LPB0260 TaxID=2614442 RepID=UPI0015C2029F|nr:alpha/beta fold hydrolase [Pseudomonas sp. LPB0260]QLC74552.1 alpha/beta fold hydrolase [Pseudomonas sp. LPB0260]QLC77321.1 alpha/beta fold hydrolase [Pseudomonas sp. LPB0260]
MKKLFLALLLLVGAAAGVFYAFPATLLASVLWLEQQAAGLSHERMEVADLSIHYYRGGPRDAETILMIHGFAADKDNWLRFARHLSEGYQVIAMDLPGFGDSSKPLASYDVGTQAERVASFVKALGVDRLHLIGNSMGGHIAALYAARYPQQVLSLALFDNAGVSAPQKSELIQRLESGTGNPLIVEKPGDFERLLDFVFVEPPLLPLHLKEHLGERASANSEHYRRIFDQLVERYIPLEPELPKIQAPTLLLWGDRDRVLDVSSIEVMRPLLPKPSVVIMKDCGHAPMIERPQDTAEHYQAFLRSTTRPDEGAADARALP